MRPSVRFAHTAYQRLTQKTLLNKELLPLIDKALEAFFMLNEQWPAHVPHLRPYVFYTVGPGGPAVV